MTRRSRLSSCRAVGLFVPLMLLSCGSDGGTSVQTLTVSVVPERALIAGIGASVDFDASARDADGNLVSGSLEWVVADPGIATVVEGGVATGVASGTTVVSATINGSTGSAELEVFVPETVAEYLPGVRYLGRKGYVEYIPGELPVVISAPHGGDLRPDEIPDRTFGVIGQDRNTAELAEAVRDALVELTGHAPHVIISRLHRAKLDPNREIVEAAQGDPYAEQAWNEFQGWIRMARTTVEEDFNRGMYFDIHGHGHDIDRLELGYLLSADVLDQSDVALNAIQNIATSSIRDLGRDSSYPFSELMRGTVSFGGFLQAEGVRSVPSPSDPSPGVDPYFTGGYNTREHGSRMDGEFISGIQIEHHFSGVRDTDENRRAYAEKLARVIRDFMLEHYGYFTPGGG